MLERLYTILYRETAKGEKRDNPAILRTNNLRRLNARTSFDPHLGHHASPHWCITDSEHHNRLKKGFSL